LSDERRADLDALIAQAASKRTSRAWLYCEHLREILDRKQINVVSAMLKQWCTKVLRSKVEPMKDVARMISKHCGGIVAWTQTRQTIWYDTDLRNTNAVGSLNPVISIGRRDNDAPKDTPDNIHAREEFVVNSVTE
jgi:hypothetical protein